MTWVRYRYKEFSFREFVYVRRWQLRIGPVSVNLHNLLGPDPRPEYYHSHTGSGLSVILRGWYEEEYPSGVRSVARFFNWIAHHKIHRIARCAPSVWTIYITYGNRHFVLVRDPISESAAKDQGLFNDYR